MLGKKIGSLGLSSLLLFSESTVAASLASALLTPPMLLTCWGCLPLVGKLPAVALTRARLEGGRWAPPFCVRPGGRAILEVTLFYFLPCFLRVGEDLEAMLYEATRTGVGLPLLWNPLEVSCGDWDAATMADMVLPIPLVFLECLKELVDCFFNEPVPFSTSLLSI